MENTELINNTLELLMLEPNFIVKNKTATGKELSAKDVITLIVEDAGASKSTDIFKGHCQIKIRQVLELILFEKPKPSKTSRAYGHILAINGLKKCPKCKEVKLLEMFSNNKAMKASGKDSWCLSCMHIQRAPNKEHLKIVKALWQKNNKQRAAAASARRRARKLQAEPIWKDLVEINSIYASCPDGYHVDHWAPLAGDNVCGLHVHYNLQYMPASLNISKSNSFNDTDTYREYGPYLLAS